MRIRAVGVDGSLSPPKLDAWHSGERRKEPEGLFALRKVTHACVGISSSPRRRNSRRVRASLGLSTTPRVHDAISLGMPGDIDVKEEARLFCLPLLETAISACVRT